jgi:S-formylglutathione hydrolase FrmB
VDFLEDIRLVDGPVVWIAWGAGVAGLAYLVWGRARRRAAGPVAVELGAAVLVAAALVAAVNWLLIYGLSVLPEELPFDILAWSLPAVAALLLWLRGIWSTWGRKSSRPEPSGPRQRPARQRRARPGLAAAAATGALLGVVALSAVQINAYFGLNHTVSDLAGSAVARIPPLEPGLIRPAGASAAVGLAGWRAPADLPEGALRRAVIPGTGSGFHSREAYIYLPPAYQSAPRPALPVLVLFSGQPGGPADWLTGGALRSRLDRFASAHAGVAPVVVVVDPNGSAAGNTLCMDSRIAQADTFLARDVPEWIKKTLDVDPDPRQWAVGGFSYGATCALQMVTRHPEVYNAALAFSSEKEPSLAKERDKTIQAAFGGDTAAFERQTPLQLMMERGFEGSAVYFGAGERDHEFIGYMDLLSAAARNAGFAVEARRIPNAGHSWDTASKGLPGGLDFLAKRWGIRP